MIELMIQMTNNMFLARSNGHQFTESEFCAYNAMLAYIEAAAKWASQRVDGVNEDAH